MKNPVILIILFNINTVFGQQISVTKIEENRSDQKGSFSNNCKIELKLSGDEVRKFKNIRLDKISKAIDDQGIDLYKTSSWGNKYNKIDIDGIVEVELEKASRKAQVIKALEGNLLIYNPTLANGGEIHVKDFKKKTTVNLLPANFPVKLLYLTKESLTKYKNDMQKKKEVDLKKLPELQRKLAETLLGLFDGLSEFGDENREIVFLREGKEADYDKIVDIYFLDENNEKVERNGYSSSGSMITYPFSKDIQANWTMVLNIESPTSVKSIPFKLQNIVLP